MKALKWIEIDLSAIRSNIRWALSQMDRGATLMAVVKADAYGHGAPAVAREAVSAGANGLGVLNTEEAARLRRENIRAPIQLLAPILPENAPEVARLKLIATIDSLAQARALNSAASARGLGVHADLDFGLGRWGIPPRELDGFLKALARLRRLKLAGLSTHIDYVAGKNAVEAEEKLGAFHRIAQRLKRLHPGLICHAANTSVFMEFSHWRMDQARLGNLLYGINPVKSRPAPLKNPWRFMARIIALRPVNKGQSIGYASEYVAPRRMLAATVPVGYSDGLTMEPAERLIGFGSGFQYWGMISGRKAPFIGRCGISHILLDVSAVPSARAGAVVELPIRRTAASVHLPRLYRA